MPTLLKPCPFCGQGPLIFVACAQCQSVFAWCAEEDHTVGRFDGPLLREIGLGASRNWARERCPQCGLAALGRATPDAVATLGFPAAEVGD